MKYLLLIHGTEELWRSFSAAEATDAIAAHDALLRELDSAGELIGAYGLTDAAQARTVRAKGAEVIVSDGPYLEAKEYVSSLIVVDVADHDRAVEVAARFPFASVGQVELWPVLTEHLPDM